MKLITKNSKSIMSDFEFDKKLKELEKMEMEQGYRDSDSPTIKPGSDLLAENNENKHGRPMLSLDNCYSFEEVEKWYNDMKKETGEDNPQVIVDCKWDGSSGAPDILMENFIKRLVEVIH